MRPFFRFVAVPGPALAAAGGPALSQQAHPARTVRRAVPLPAGGVSTDGPARALAQKPGVKHRMVRCRGGVEDHRLDFARTVKVYEAAVAAPSR